jgi:hypothetical protein
VRPSDGTKRNEIIRLSAWFLNGSERVWRRQNRAASIRKTPDNSLTLATFIAREAEIDTILARLIALSGEHFNTDPDEATWAHVGTLGSYLDGLRRVSDAAFHEGEHAS